jgi:hypothetical protein
VGDVPQWWSRSSVGAAAGGPIGPESNDRFDGFEPTGDVAVVPDVWADTQPSDESPDPTPLYLGDPLADKMGRPPSDLVIDTQPGESSDLPPPS